MRYTTKLLPSQSGSVGIVTLNNLGSLNALTLDMMYSLQDILKEWYTSKDNNTNDTIKAILFKSATPTLDDNSGTSSKPRPKVFCAGGDVKQVYLSGLQEYSVSKSDPDSSTKTSSVVQPKTLEFFRQEYLVNAMLATYGYNDNKNSNTTNNTTTTVLPHISLWDGIVMGGGVGVSIWSKYRIATENTVWAMPETAIGLFPDVGSMYWMTRNLSPSIATYLALTGQRLHAADLLSSGIATHYIPSTQLPTLEYDIISAIENEKQSSSTSLSTLSTDNIIAPILMSYHLNVPDTKSIIHKNRNYIHTIFGDALKTTGQQEHRVTMEEIMLRLENQIKNNTKDNDDEKLFYQQTYETIQQMSPTSCKITLEGLYRSYNINKTIYDNLTMEYRLVNNILQNIKSDFYTGIESKLINKSKLKPNWNPVSFEAITDDIVQSYFDTPVAPNNEEEEWYFPSELQSLRTKSSVDTPPTSNL